MTESVYDCDGDNYGAVEIHPVRDIGHLACEICDPDDADYWSVYGRAKAGGLMWLDDFDTFELAMREGRRLSERWAVPIYEYTGGPRLSPTLETRFV